jgi:hypothetical protein
MVNLSVELYSRQEIPLPKPRLIIKNETSSENSSSEDLYIDVKEASPNPASFLLIYKKTQYIYYIGKLPKPTFSRPAKIMDHIESHLYKEPAETVAYRHPVYKAKGLVLNSIIHFKDHMEMVHGIRLREPKYKL